MFRDSLLRFVLLTLLVFHSVEAHAAARQFSDVDSAWTSTTSSGLSGSAVPTDSVFLGGQDGSRTSSRINLSHDTDNWIGCTDLFDTPVGSNQTSGLPDGICDDFGVVPAGFRLRAGELVVGPDFALNVGGVTHIEGGTLRLQGDPTVITRIASRVSSNASDTYTFTDPLPAGLDGRTDLWLVRLDDDPPNPWQPITLPPQLGGGPPKAGFHRASLNWGSWHPLTSVNTTTGVVVADMNQSSAAYSFGTTAPYTGTRGQRVDALVTSVSLTLSQAGDHTVITIPPGDNVLVRNDLGGKYVLVEPSSVNNVEECETQSRFWKISDSSHGAVNDTITVIGNILACSEDSTALDFRIDDGVDVGDPVAIVAPAVYSGQDTGAIVWTSGRFQGEWCLIRDLGPRQVSVLPVEPYPVSPARFNFLVAQETAVLQPDDANSWFRNCAVLQMNDDLTGDTAVFTMTSYDNTGMRFPGTILDMSGFDYHHVYFADTKNNNCATCGAHGNYHYGVKSSNWWHHIRVERMTDDGFGGHTKCWPGEPTPGIKVAALRIYENIATNDTSQQGFEFGQFIFGDAGVHSLGLCSKALTHDVASIEVFGMQSGSGISGMGDRVRGVMAGPSADPFADGFMGLMVGFQINVSADQNCSAIPGVPGSHCTGSQLGDADTATDYADDFWSWKKTTVEDSYIHLDGPNANVNAGTFTVEAANNIWVSTAPSPHNMVGPISSDGNIVFVENTPSQIFNLNFAGEIPKANVSNNGGAWKIHNTIASGGATGAGYLCASANEYFTHPDIDGYFHLGGNTGSSWFNACWFSAAGLFDGVTYRMHNSTFNGLIKTQGFKLWQQSGPIDAGPDNAQDFLNICYEHDIVADPVAGVPTQQLRSKGYDNSPGLALPADRLVTVLDNIEPHAGDNATMGTLVKPPGAEAGSCDSARPAYGGISKTYSSFYNMGAGTSTRKAMDSTFAPGRGLFDSFASGGGSVGIGTW